MIFDIKNGYIENKICNKKTNIYNLHYVILANVFK